MSVCMNFLIIFAGSHFLVQIPTILSFLYYGFADRLFEDNAILLNSTSIQSICKIIFYRLWWTGKTIYYLIDSIFYKIGYLKNKMLIT